MNAQITNKAIVLMLEVTKAEIESERFQNRSPCNWELSKAEAQADRLLYMLDIASEALVMAIDHIKQLEGGS